MPRLFAIATTLVFPALAGAQTAAQPPADAPSSIQPPAGEKLILQAHATGWQIYTCGAGTDGKPAWTLKAPDADLHDEKGAVVGHHSAGPSWKYKDGSQVIGKAIAHTDAPETKGMAASSKAVPSAAAPQVAAPSIPWLLVSAVGHSGDGLFGGVTYVQRLHTEGGQPPAASACDPAKPSAESRSSYTADYYFYAPAK
jgi:hypothetical protein